MNDNTKPGTIAPYDLPPDWDAKTPEEKSDWFTRQRCRKLAKRVQSPALVDEHEDIRERAERKMEASPAFAKIER